MVDAGVAIRADIAVVEAAERIEDAIAKTLAVFGGEQRARPAVEPRPQCQILVDIDGPEIRQAEMKPVGVRIAEARHQKAAGAFHPRLGLRHIGRVEYRPAVDLHDNIAELQQLVFLVVADLPRLQLPGRRRRRIVATEVAG